MKNDIEGVKMGNWGFVEVWTAGSIVIFGVSIAVTAVASEAEQLEEPGFYYELSSGILTGCLIICIPGVGRVFGWW